MWLIITKLSFGWCPHPMVLQSFIYACLGTWRLRLYKDVGAAYRDNLKAVLLDRITSKGLCFARWLIGSCEVSNYGSNRCRIVEVLWKALDVKARRKWKIYYPKPCMTSILMRPTLILTIQREICELECFGCSQVRHVWGCQLFSIFVNQIREVDFVVVPVLLAP